MEEKSNRRPLKITVIAVLLLFLTIQLYKAFYNPITTGSVINYTTDNGINLQVIAIRDETVLTADESGVISYEVDDGEKVKNGGIVADMYASESDADNVLRIEELESTIKDLKEVDGYNSTEAVDIDVLDAKTDNVLYTFIDNVNDGNISDTAYGAQLLKLINRRQAATGVSDGFSALINKYESELQTLKSDKKSPISSIVTENSGYFSSAVDGYENTLKPADVQNLTPNDLKNLSAQSGNQKGKTVGKIVSDYEWYLAAQISIDDCLKFKKGESFILRTEFASVPELPVTVKCVNKGDAGDKAVVVFSCTYMNGDLATMRQKEMTVVLETYSGLQVNSKAIRFLNGQKGVYVVSGAVLNFVPVNVIYSTDNYCICEAQTTGVRLKLYDEVVIKGKNLYDGKVID